MKRITVYPDPRTLKILGRSSPQLNAALECWASRVVQGAAEVEALLTRAEWSYLADCLNGHAADPDEDGATLALSVHDAHEFDGIGDKWFESEVTEHVAELKSKLLGLSYPAVWAVFIAIRFFWDNHDTLDMKTDEWWRVSFRTRFERDENTQEDDSEQDV